MEIVSTIFFAFFFASLLWFINWIISTRSVNVRGYPIIGAALYLGTEPFKFLSSCKEKYGGVFSILMAGNRFFVDGSRDFTKAVMKAPIEDAESGSGVIKTFGINLFVNLESIQSYIHVEILKTTFSANLPKFLPFLYKLAMEKFEKMPNQVTFKDILAELCYPFACQLTTRSILGPEFDYDTELHQLFTDYNKLAEKMMAVALYVPTFLHPLFKAQVKKQDDIVRRKLTPIINARRKLTPEQSAPYVDLLQSLISRGKGDEEILTTVKTIMWAALMNTASATHHTLLDLYSNPTVLQKVIEEQEKSKELSYESLEKFELLDACFKESLRLASPAIGSVRELHRDFQIPDYPMVPKDSIVLISRYLLHHDEKYWNNAFEYHPERFLPPNKIKNWSYIPFGGGHNSCPGRFYATFLVKLIVSLVIRNFNVKIMGPRPPYKVLGNEVRSFPVDVVFTKK